jgi:hypothetical protein
MEKKTMPTNKFPVEPIKVKVLGVEFQAFVDPATSQPVFSQSGTADALGIRESTVRSILTSQAFKALRGSDFPRGRLYTTVNSQPIAVVTQTDLVFLVQIAAEKGNPVAKAMQEASFAVLVSASGLHQLSL